MADFAGRWMVGDHSSLPDKQRELADALFAGGPMTYRELRRVSGNRGGGSTRSGNHDALIRKNVAIVLSGVGPNGGEGLVHIAHASTCLATHGGNATPLEHRPRPHAWGLYAYGKLLSLRGELGVEEGDLVR